MMKKHFCELFDYERWADAKIIDALSKLPAPDEKCLELFSHILTARLAWLARIENKEFSFPVGQTRTFESCVQTVNENLNDWKSFLDAADEREFSRIVVYKNTKGEPFETPVKDILTHVVNHSTHHRGQIVFKLKEQISSLPTDYILYTREI